MKDTRRSLSVLLGAVTLVVLSCGEPPPVGLDPPPPPSQGDLLAPPSLGSLLQCSPLPYDSVTQTIGPEGGTLQVGPHTLSVPPGALAEPVSITAVAPSSSVRSVRFEPSGLTFGQPAALTMSYANCGPLTTLYPKRIAYTTDHLEILSYLASFDNWPTLTVTGQLEHFSTYAVAW
jgi:hypothetical protein